MYLIYDASGVGSPKSWKADVSDTFNWPRMIHLSWIMLNEEYKPIKDFDCIVKPEGFILDKTTSDKAKIDQEDINAKGEKLKDILENFSQSVNEAKHIFSHNQNYNENVVGAEFIRKNMRNPLPLSDSYCIMRESTWYCKLKGKGGGYKWPSLTELHAILFETRFTPANNARADVIAASRCFIKLMMLGELEDCFDLD